MIHPIPYYDIKYICNVLLITGVIWEQEDSCSRKQSAATKKKKTVRGLFLYEPIALNHGDLDKMAINWNNIS